MNYSQEEIIAALKLIQNVCNEHTACAGCPFRTADNVPGSCELRRNAPSNWSVKDNENEWRAFQ